MTFAREALGVELWPRQVEALEAIRDHKRVALRAGRKVSKSHTAALAALWWPIAWPDGRVVVTSSSARQIRNVIWAELRVLAARAPALYPEPAQVPDIGIRWLDGRFILGFSTDTPERAASISGAHLLYLVDEASGIDDELYRAIQGNVGGGGTIVLISNPTRPSGLFYDAFHGQAALWHGLHISSLESPNVVSGKDTIPGLATRAWVEEMAEAWGRDSAAYAVHVLGEFPGQADDTIVSLAAVTAAVERWPDTPADGVLSIGVDVARFGDDASCIAYRRGRKLLGLEVVRGADGHEVAGRVLAIVARLADSRDRRPPVKVDEIGVGASVVDALRRSDPQRVTVVPVNVSTAGGDDYHNLRSQLWFAVAQWLKDGGALPPDAHLQAELVTPRFGFDSRGRRQVEPKDEVKRRLGRSPDRADAVALSIYAAAPMVARPRPVSETAGYRWSSNAGRGFG